MNPIEQIITRVNELGIAMAVRDGRLLLEGNLLLLSTAEREEISRQKDELVAYLTAPRERVAIICKHRQPDGRACGEIVTVQEPTGKVAWCLNCYRAPDYSGEAVDTREKCWCCGNRDWWTSVHGQRICRTCHPPANPSLEIVEEEDEDPSAIPRAFDSVEIVPNLPHVVLPLLDPAAERVPCAPAMYVAEDLDHWIADEPHIWADKVGICGKPFVRVTPVVIVWFKEQIARAEAACDARTLPVDDFAKIISAFCPVYEFAVRTGMVPDPVENLEMNGGMKDERKC